MRTELYQLVRAPGLYLFVPLILIQTLLNEYGVGRVRHAAAQHRRARSPPA